MFITTQILAISLFAADIQLEQIVPDTTIAFLETDNVGNIIQSFDCESVLNSMELDSMESKTIQRMLNGNISEEFFGRLGIEKEEWNPPTGSMGLAIYPVVDYEFGTVGMGFFMFVELDEKLYSQFFTDVFDELSESDSMSLESVSLSGRDIMFSQMQIENNIPSELSFMAESMQNVYFTFSDGYFMIASEPDSIASAFSAIDDDIENNRLNSNEDYQKLKTRCGNEGDIFCGILLENLADTFVQMDTSGMGMMFLPMLKSIMGDVDAVANTVLFSTDQNPMKAKCSILMKDGRNGLMGLIGDGGTDSTTPNFIAENYSFIQGEIDINNFAPLMNKVMSENPMLSMQMGQDMQQMELTVKNFLKPLGSKFYYYSTGSVPVDMDAIGYLFAMECEDELSFSSSLGLTLPMMGAVPTDFLGNQIFTMDLGASMPMPMPMSMEISIAVGGGYVFLGTPNTIQNALRAIANPNEYKSNYAKNPAIEYIDTNNVSSWGYINMRMSLDIQNEITAKLEESMFEEMEAFDPEMAAEMRKEFEQQSGFYDGALESISSMMGNMAWTLTTEDDGFTGNLIMLKP